MLAFLASANNSKGRLDTRCRLDTPGEVLLMSKHVSCDFNLAKYMYVLHDNSCKNVLRAIEQNIAYLFLRRLSSFLRNLLQLPCSLNILVIMSHSLLWRHICCFADGRYLFKQQRNVIYS